MNMTNFTYMIFDNLTFYMLSLMIAASLFFLMAGIRELKDQCFEGLLYITIAMFFIAAHTLLLLNLPIDNTLSMILSRMNLWVWLSMIFAPALIFLFLLFGLYNFIMNNARLGLTKIFFGLTLICFLFMLGTDWPVDLKGIITFLFCIAWFDLELSTAK